MAHPPDPTDPLTDVHVLVVEDEYLVAMEMASELQDRGAVVVGPVGDVASALGLAAAADAIDVAVLDVNLGGDWVFPVADRLSERGVPSVFVTGYDDAAIPASYAAVERVRKPVQVEELVEHVSRLVQSMRPH